MNKIKSNEVPTLVVDVVHVDGTENSYLNVFVCNVFIGFGIIVGVVIGTWI